MGNLKFFEELMESKLLDTHTAFVAKVVATDGKVATVQPLGYTKQYGKAAKEQANLIDIPVANGARYQYTLQKTTYVKSIATSDGHVTSVDYDTKDFAVLTPLKAGDTVVCVCGERDISNAKSGVNAAVTVGRHSFSNAIVIAALGG